jgi:REP element-mobilizing transposase RayT
VKPHLYEVEAAGLTLLTGNGSICIVPVRMMTLHAYGSWLPDQREGYFHHSRGLQPADEHRARIYRERQRDETVAFSPEQQRVIFEILRQLEPHLNIRLHAVSVDGSHLHALVDWRHDRDGRDLARSLRYSLTLRLNKRFGKRKWFTHRGHLRAVKDADHFHKLRDEYIPSHDGTVWRSVRE